MFKRIHKWFLARAVEGSRKIERAGFSWAISQYFNGEMSIFEIEAHASTIDYTAFDMGIERAIRLLVKLNLTGGGDLYVKLL